MITKQQFNDAKQLEKEIGELEKFLKDIESGETVPTVLGER